MFYTYVIKSDRCDEVYVGSTSNLKRRLTEHNQGLNFSTKKYKPCHLIYYEACIEEQDAKRREYYFKTTQGKRMLRKRTIEYWRKEWSKNLIN